MVGAAIAAGMVGSVDAQPKLPKSTEPRQLAPDRAQDRSDDVPPAYRPPPGMCRIWLDNVAPAQQPAPTDCNTAVRNRPANARVLFGDDYAKGARGGSGAARRRRPPARFAGESVLGTAPATPLVATVLFAAVRWVPGLGSGLGPAAGAEAAQPPVTRRPVRRAAAADRDDELAAAPPADDWEAGYAAGYRDAMRGRRPRVRGADRTADRGADRLLDPGDAEAPGADPVVVVPSGADVDPRYFNNGRFPPPGRANGVCLDRDADGWCDDPRFGAPVCRDLDGDGRCDDYPALAAAPLPATLPDMRAGADVRRGVGSATALRWLGTSEVIARATGAGRGGAPSRVVWLDANTGALLQVWTDRDADGVADRVEIYRNGRRVKLVGR